MGRNIRIMIIGLSALAMGQFALADACSVDGCSIECDSGAASCTASQTVCTAYHSTDPNGCSGGACSMYCSQWENVPASCVCQ